MATIQGLLFLFLGLGVLVVDYRGYRNGWLPFGSRGLTERYEIRRDEKPGMFLVVLLFYGVGGLWLTLYAVGLLLGNVAPLPLR